MRLVARMLLAVSIALLCVTALLAAAEPPVIPELLDEPVISKRATTVLAGEALSFLESQSGSTVRVWVFFADKGVRNKSEFAAKAAAVRLPERSLARRAKVHKDMVVFADLPVQEQYVAGVRNAGATIRHISPWLNAVSCEVPKSALPALSALPFVSKVSPVAVYRRPLEEISQAPDTGDLLKDQGPALAATPDALNYGPAEAQLSQINVPAVHEKGLHGEGVTLAIFDSGMRKTHEAFAIALLENRVLDEWDFIFDDGNVQNEGLDDPSQWNHGTYIWSVSGGQKDGSIYGPAYKANFLLYKTEDVRSETQVEEDNWVAAVQRADSMGADVITSSLGYSDWYVYADYNGSTCVTTIAANIAVGLGIVHCNSMGNSGSAPGTLSAPADAFESLSCGSVNSAGLLAGSSSRGPTADGRIKPEVCARGVSTYSASASGTTTYSSPSGTSLSTPLVAGTACLLIQARPTFPPQLIRQAMMETASRASIPDNNYGWGIINAEAAIEWGASVSVNQTVGMAPMAVSFTGSSPLSVSGWDWDFGDGNNSTLQNPDHVYTNPGSYTVTLTVQTPYGPIASQKSSYIHALGDTLNFSKDSVFAGQRWTKAIVLTNSQPLQRILIPFKVAASPVQVSIDSITRGSRTAYFEMLRFVNANVGSKEYTIELVANDGGGAPDLPPGSGGVLNIYGRSNLFALGGQGTVIDTLTISGDQVGLTAPAFSYSPTVVPGSFALKNILRGDFNYDFTYDITDLQGYIDRLFFSGPPPITFQSGDWFVDFQIDISDLNACIDYLFFGGPTPVYP